MSRSYSFVIIFLLTFFASPLFAQSTGIAVTSTVLQPSVKRLGINLGTLTSYDSGQTLQNLFSSNPGFEGQLWNSTIRCAYGTATSCTDEDQWSGWPAGFWTGATYEIFYGAAAGRTGTVASSTAVGNGEGIILNFADSGTAPAQGDYLILHKTVPGGSTFGWSPYIYGAATITDNLTDLPPGTQGKQTVALSAPTQNDFASISNYCDSTPGISFVQLNGTYQLQFKAKGTGGSKQIYIQLFRSGVTTYLNQTLTLTNSWNTYNLTFTAAETGSALGTLGVTFSTIGATSFELDDVSFTQTNTSPSNPTAFRDPVVTALRSLQPGILRYWGGQLGDTLDNLLTPQFGRQTAGYSPWFNAQYNYGLHDFLALCQTVGAEPWFVVPTTFSTTDASNLIQYLAGATTTTYGAKRSALGQATPWTQVFSKIHLEFGNEAWNTTFKGGSIEYPQPYGQRAQAIFGVMRANPAYVASSFDLVLGGQAASPGLNTGIQDNCNNNDSFDVAPYLMGTVDSYSDNESLFGSTFAEPEALMSSASAAAAEGLTPGMVYQDYQAIQTSANPVPLSFYETNMGTLNGSITQAALNSYASSLGAGLAVVDDMLQALQNFGVVNQELFALPQYEFNRPDGSSVYLWGSVVDMGVTNRKRPQYLALELANQALSPGASMLQTVQSGANPTWSQALVNTVELPAAHYLQSYAFAQGADYSLVVFNLSRSSALPVTFSGVNAPSGTVQMQQLTSANLTDTNEAANVVGIQASALSNFNPSSGLSLPPYSMTVLTWAGNSFAAAPVISAVTASSVTATSATIAWTTSQPSSALVNYGSSTAYGSSSALNSALSTTQSVTLSGLTPGTTYDYDVVSANAAGTAASSANYTFTTPTEPPVISAVTAGSITTTSATITWTTDQASSSLVEYGTTTGYGGFSALNSTLATAHSVTLTGLTPGTTYDYEVVSANGAGNSASSTNFTFTTSYAGAAPAPNVGYVAFWGITSTGVTISWSTDVPATTQVAYGPTSALGQLSPLQTTLAASHGVVLSGLASGTTYYFVAQSTGADGATGYSTVYSFTTQAAVGLTPPNLGYVSAWGITSSTATITWSTDVNSTTQVAYGTTSALGQLSPLQTSAVVSHGVTLTGLNSGTTYYFVAESTGANGATGYSTTYSFTTPQAPLGAPVISAVASFPNNTTATITWTTDQASSSQVNYGLTSAYGSSSATNYTLVTSHSVALAGLTPNTTYNYQVVSANSAGTSDSSANFTFTTPAQQSGPNIGYLAFWGITTSGVTISWSTDVAATTQVAYGTTPSLGQLSPLQSSLTASHGVTLTGLNSGTTYYFVAESTGSNGITNYSTTYSFTTTAAVSGPPALSSIVVTPAANNVAQISWTTSTPTYSYVQYGTTTAYTWWSPQTPLTSTPQVSLSYVPSGVVHYQLVSTDAFGTQTVSPDYTFTEP